MNHLRYIALGFITASLLIPAHAADKSKKPAAKPYPLSKCVVSDEKLGSMGEPFVFTYEGREVKLCCKSCEKDFKKEATKFAKKIDEAAKLVKAYPLQTCLVSDEKFGGDMGEPYVFIHEGREIRLCCESCLKDFKKSEAKFIKKWDAAAKKEKQN